MKNLYKCVFNDVAQKKENYLGRFKKGLVYNK